MSADFFLPNGRTRAVQKVIETLKTPEQFSMIVSSLKPGIVTLMKNVNGNHVAQRCLQKLVPAYSEVRIICSVHILFQLSLCGNRNTCVKKMFTTLCT